MLEIKINDGIAPEKWEGYVEKSASSTFCHLYKWRKVIEETFKHNSFYLAAEKDGEIKGVIPLFEIRSRIFGSALVSIPFLDYGGICAEDEGIGHVLLEKVREIVSEQGVDYLELRHRGREVGGLTSNPGKVNLKLKLCSDPDVIWKDLDAKVRNQVRKAQKSGLKFVVGGINEIRPFYGVFSRNMRDLGTPVYSRDFFFNIMKEFPDQAEVFLVKGEGAVIGGAIAFYFKDQMEIPWASSLREYFAYCPNNLLYWEAIKRGCQKGCELFNFGRSRYGTSHYRFKKQWGAEDEELAYQFYSEDEKLIPDLNPSSSKYRMAVNIWKKLPLAVAERLGPGISRCIP
jgi:FemAB-related protein (PEP-CTERM system-associated)